LVTSPLLVERDAVRAPFIQSGTVVADVTAGIELSSTLLAMVIFLPRRVSLGLADTGQHTLPDIF